LSFGPFLSEQDVQFAADALADVALTMRRHVRPTRGKDVQQIVS
jgi:hypothetical protein